MAVIRNFFAGIGCLTVIAVLAVAAWIYRDDIRAWITSGDEIVMAEPSAELAERAEQKLRAIAEGTAPDQTRISELELQSWVQYRLAEQLPEGVYNPAVDLRDSTVAVSAELVFSRLAAPGSAADGLRRLMGDSATVVTELFPVVEGSGVGGVTVLSLQAGVVPVPPMFIPNILRQAGLETGEGGRTVIFAIPVQVTEIRIVDEEIVLSRHR